MTSIGCIGWLVVRGWHDWSCIRRWWSGLVPFSNRCHRSRSTGMARHMLGHSIFVILLFEKKVIELPIRQYYDLSMRRIFIEKS